MPARHRACYLRPFGPLTEGKGTTPEGWMMRKHWNRAGLILGLITAFGACSKKDAGTGDTGIATATDTGAVAGMADTGMAPAPALTDPNIVYILDNANMLDSAMARPLNLVAYGDPDAADLAASYAFGIARNHPFVDGNKRTAAVVSETFLMLNGYRLTCSDVEMVMTFLALAAGELSVEALSDWFREHIEPDT